MKKQSDPVRYNFTLTDEEGYVLLSSFRDVAVGENIFTVQNFSAEDISFATRRLREQKHEHIILMRSKKDRSAVFICSFLFPSTRTVTALYTNIKYSVAADLCSLYHSDVAFRERSELSKTREHERTYIALENVLFSLNAMFCAEYHESVSYSFGRYLRDKAEEIARLTFCGIELSFDNEYTLSMPDGFDGGMLGLFLLIMLSAASELSPLRRASVRISALENGIYAEVVFNTLLEKKTEFDFDQRYRAAIRRLKDACERLNMPTYYLKSGIIKTGIIPTRADVSRLGLKAGQGYLKNEEQRENEESNIFTFVFSAADE